MPAGNHIFFHNKFNRIFATSHQLKMQFILIIRAQKIRTTAVTKNLFKSNLPKEYYVNKLNDKTHEVDGLQKCIRTLQVQLADAKAAAAAAVAATTTTTTTLSTNIDNNQNADEILAAAAAQLVAQAESWRAKIDSVYQDILSAQENFYTMSSKEKLLKLRTQLKENTEKSRKTFNIDGEFMKRVSLKFKTHFPI